MTRAFRGSTLNRLPKLAASVVRGIVYSVFILLLAGCSQANSTRLPELSAIPRKLLSAEEQKRAVDDLKAHKDTAQAEAIKEIEAAKPRHPQPASARAPEINPTLDEGKR